MPLNDKEQDAIALQMQRLLAGPARPGQAFTMPGVNYDGLYRMARQFKALFDGREQPWQQVALFTDDRTVVAAAMLATLAGGPTLLLPYALSDRALDDLHTLTGVGAVIGPPPAKAPDGVRWIDPHGLDEAVESLAIEDTPDPDRPWVCLFTGGSTGAPQLWTKTARNLLGETDYLIRRFDINSADRILASVPPLHIYGLLYSLLVPLLAAARVAATTPSFPEEIKQQMADWMPTLFVSVPVHYRALKESPPPAGTLRLATSSAGPLAEEDGVAFSQATGVELVEIYGSTETGGIATRCRQRGENGLTPYDCIQWRVAGHHLDVRSAFLSAELPVRASGWFTVADRVKPEGSGFVVTGRVDSIVKVGGNRVDLERVRQKLASLEGVADAFVLAGKSPTGREQQIEALVVGDWSTDEIRNALAALLEPHEIPRRFHIVPQIPMASTGKIDRRKVDSLIAAGDREPHQGSSPGATDSPPDRPDVKIPVRRLVRKRAKGEGSCDGPDTTRLETTLCRAGLPADTPVDLAFLRQLAALPPKLEEATLVVYEDKRLVRILAGNQPTGLGLGLTLKKSGVKAILWDLASGEELASESCGKGKKRVPATLASEVNTLTRRTLESIGALAAAIDLVVVSGEALLQQRLAGIAGQEKPPLTRTLPEARAGELGLDLDPTVPVIFLPVVLSLKTAMQAQVNEKKRESGEL